MEAKDVLPVGHRVDNYFENIKSLVKIHYKDSYPNMDKHILYWEHGFFSGLIKARCTMTKPCQEGRQADLIRKCLHLFMNGRRAHGTYRLYACFYDLFRDFKTPNNALPFVVFDIEAPVTVFDIKVMGEYRKFYFKPQYEKPIYEAIRAHLWSEFGSLALNDADKLDQINKDPNSKAYRAPKIQGKSAKQSDSYTFNFSNFNAERMLDPVLDDFYDSEDDQHDLNKQEEKEKKEQIKEDRTRQKENILDRINDFL